MRDRIFITAADHDALSRLIAGRRTSGTDTGYLDELEQELERAEILHPDQPVPDGVVTMNSEVHLMDIDSGETLVYRLVLPSQSRSANALSVLAPIGTAILGYAIGDVIEWRVPKGVRRLEVLHVSHPAAQHGKASAA